MRWKAIQTNWFSGKDRPMVLFMQIIKKRTTTKGRRWGSSCHNNLLPWFLQSFAIRITQTSFSKALAQHPVILLLTLLLKDGTEYFRLCNLHPFRDVSHNLDQLKWDFYVLWTFKTFICFSWTHYIFLASAVFYPYKEMCIRFSSLCFCNKFKPSVRSALSVKRPWIILESITKYF